jgi:hypothetical protein
MIQPSRSIGSVCHGRFVEKRPDRSGELGDVRVMGGVPRAGDRDDLPIPQPRVQGLGRYVERLGAIAAKDLEHWLAHAAQCV